MLHRPFQTPRAPLHPLLVCLTRIAQQLQAIAKHRGLSNSQTSHHHTKVIFRPPILHPNNLKPAIPSFPTPPPHAPTACPAQARPSTPLGLGKAHRLPSGARRGARWATAPSPAVRRASWCPAPGAVRSSVRPCVQAAGGRHADLPMRLSCPFRFFYYENEESASKDSKRISTGPADMFWKWTLDLS